MSFWGRIRRVVFWRSSYLEDELKRTREELQRWQDAMLISKGLPQVTPHEAKPLSVVKGKLLPSQYRRRAEELSRTKAVSKSDGAN